MHVIPRIVRADPVVNLFDFTTEPDRADTAPWSPTGYKWDFIGGRLDAKGGWWPDVGGSIGIVECWLDGYEREYWTMDVLVTMYDSADNAWRVHLGAMNGSGGASRAIRYNVDWSSSTTAIEELYIGGAPVASAAIPAATVRGWAGKDIKLRLSNEGGRVRVWTPAVELAPEPVFDHAADVPTNRPALMLHGHEWRKFQRVALSHGVGGEPRGGIARTTSKGAG